MFEPGEPHFAFAAFLCYVGRGVYVVPLSILFSDMFCFSLYPQPLPRHFLFIEDPP